MLTLTLAAFAVAASELDNIGVLAAPVASVLVLVLLGAIALLRETRRRRDAEQALAEARGAVVAPHHPGNVMLANIGHELRTPVNAIVGFAEMIDHEIVGPVGNPKYREYSRDIRGAALHLLRLIDNLLDAARLAEKRTTVEEDVIDLGSTIDLCLDILRWRAVANDIDISRGVSAGLPQLRADEVKVRQMLLNVIDNAIKFTPRGGKVRVEACEVAGNGITLTVSDTGIGMAPSDIPVAMTPFGQAARLESRLRRQGVGLGLPLVRALTELHGGRMSLRSVKDSGTVVTLAFPPQRSIRIPAAGQA